MKKTATLLGAFALSLLSFQGFSQVKLGVKAGLNVSSFSYDIKDSEDEKEFKDATKTKIGYHLGLAAEYGFSEKLSLQTGLMWTNKGAKLEKTNSETDEDTGAKYTMEIEESLSLNYLEIPINLAYKINNFQIHAGPYVAVGVSGKDKYDVKTTVSFMGQTETESENEEVDVKFKNTVKESDFDSDEDVTFFRALDYGLNFGVGYLAGPVLINLTSSIGLGNVNPTYDGFEDEADDFKIKNQVFGLSATYYFGGK